MKRKIAVILAVLLVHTIFMPIATGNTLEEESIDFSSMKTDEIINVINSGYSELRLRAESSTENKTIYNLDGITIQLTGNHLFEEREQNGDYLEMSIIIINDNDVRYYIGSSKMYINGWEIVAYQDGGYVDAHSKSRLYCFKFGGLNQYAGVSSLNEIEYATLKIRVTRDPYPNDGTREERIVDAITLVYSEESGFIVVPNR